MQLLYALLVPVLIKYGTAVKIQIRDGTLNSTTTTPSESIQTVVEPDEELESTPTRHHRPRPEVTATGWDEPTTILQNVAPSGGSQPNVGDILQSFLTATSQLAAPSVHTERSADGWQDSDQESGRFKASAVGNPQDNRPEVTPPPTRPSLLPPVVIGPVTLRPSPVTSAQVVIVGDRTITTPVVSFQYVVGATVLPIGSLTTIDGVGVALNVNSNGATILVVGDATSTLSAPAHNALAAQVTTAPQQMQISTVIADGSTQYILGGQTLSPGQAMTIGGIPISYTTKDGTTVLAVGSSTTTLTRARLTSTGDWGASVAATPGNDIGNNNRPATTSRAGAMPTRQSNLFLVHLAGIAGVLLRLA